MCGRYTVHTPLQVIANLFEVDAEIDFQPRYNVAPSQNVPVIREGNEHSRELVLMRWGLVPFWAKDPKIGYKLINARSESVDERPAFRNAFKKRRCLIVADGFYEWKKEGNHKQPYFIHLKDNAPFAFAGLWENWQPKDSDNEITSCTILTTQANPFIEKLHDRMPVVLPPEAYAEWLNQEVDAKNLKKWFKPYDATQMAAYPVSSHVNSPRFDDKECVTKVEKEI